MSWVVDLARHRAATEEWLPVFGVVVYTDVHANVKKMLRDDDYWTGLDESTGPVWDVFSVRALQGCMTLPSPPPGMVAMMIPVWKEPRANSDLIEAFELQDTRDLPCLVIFAMEGESLHRAIVKIDDSSIANAYGSLSSGLRRISAVIEETQNAGRPQAREVFAAVADLLQRDKTWKRLRNAYRILRELRGWSPV